MTHRRIIILNGPPRAGKDLCAQILRRLVGYKLLRFSDPLKAAIPAFLDTPFATLEEGKDEPDPLIPGDHTFRQLQISLSEDWAKKVFSPEIFGRLLALRIRRNVLAQHGVVVPDGGFIPELEGLHDHLEDAQIFLIKLVRPGHDFSGDSRGYLDPDDTDWLPRVTHGELHNTGSISTLQSRLCDLVRAWHEGLSK